jgi:DNA-binding response OmpR family regulator
VDTALGKAECEAVSPDKAAVLERDGVRVDFYRHQAFTGERTLDLTPTEFRLLEYLLRHPGEVCTRAVLDDAVLRNKTRYHHCIDQHVMELRRKLARPGLIQTVWGIGYRLGLSVSIPTLPQEGRNRQLLADDC